MLYGFPGGSDNKASAYNVGDLGSIPRSGRSPGEGNGNPFQYFCLENPMDRGAWWTTVYGNTESDTTEQLHLLYIQLTFEQYGFELSGFTYTQNFSINMYYLIHS